MRYLLISLIIWGASGAMLLSAGPAQEPDPVHRPAYQRWLEAIDANPMLGDAFWLNADHGPAAMRTAITNLVSAGPNLVPFIVRESRTEPEQRRPYLLMLLLQRVSGINVFSNSGEENYHAAAPKLMARFVGQWDSGDFENATVLLRTAWKDPDPANAVERIDPKTLTPVLRYGVFAIPFIAEGVEKQNSPELFAAFLVITGLIAGQTDQYVNYLDSPSAMMPSREQKLAFIKSWAAKNLDKVDRLKGLHGQITYWRSSR